MKENKGSEGLTFYLVTFLKGLFMGAADVIPGVSGGTIAFITGIYERFILGLNNLRIFIGDFFKIFVTKRTKFVKPSIKSFQKTVDYKFFIPLILGIGIAFLIGASFIPYLMDTYPAYVFSLFAGLILASAIVVYKKIEGKTINGWLTGLFGLILGFLLAVIPGSEVGLPNHLWIFIVGIISICAMMLPGLSGSYMVLILGQYSFLLNSVHEIGTYWSFVLAFAVGAIIGLLLFSKVLAYLLKKYHSATLFFLTGLMIGAIYRPGLEIVTSLSSTVSIVLSVIFLVIGILVVLMVEKIAKKK